MSINPLFAKALTSVGLVLVLLIPLNLVRDVVIDRTQYRAQAAASIARQWSGAQRIAAPVLVLRYRRTVTEEIWNNATRQLVRQKKIERHVTFVAAESLDVTIDAPVEQRAYGIYAVPVYTAAIAIEARFSATTLEQLAGTIDGFESWEAAELTLTVADARGLAAVPVLAVDGAPLTIEPGSKIAGSGASAAASLPVSALATPFTVSAALRLRGSTSLAVVPLGDEARYQVTSSWPHPGFHGQFLPAARTISDDGFTAVYEVSGFASRAVETLRECGSLGCASLGSEAFAVAFTNPVDIYVKTDRATKYAILLILIAFVAFFLLDTLAGRYLHPVNYGLVGSALVVFYLLLLALAEHTGFAAAYAIATLACASLTGTYLRPMLGTALAGAFALAQVLLNAVLFGILASEDHALMAGSLLVFAVLAAVMLATRRVDWRRAVRR